MVKKVGRRLFDAFIDGVLSLLSWGLYRPSRRIKRKTYSEMYNEWEALHKDWEKVVADAQKLNIPNHPQNPKNALKKLN